MKVHLLYPDRDSDWRWVSRAATLRDAQRTGRRAHDLADFRADDVLPWNTDALIHDFGLDALFAAAAGEADDVFVTVRRELLTGPSNALDTILYRQAMLRDALAHAETVRALHALAAETVAEHRRHFLGHLSRDYPDTVLRWAIDLLRASLGLIERLRALAADRGGGFEAPGWRRFFAMIESDLNETYVAELAGQLDALRMRDGVALSAALGDGNRFEDYRLHEPLVRDLTWFQRLLRRWFPSFFKEEEGRFGFSVAPSDESGNRALREFRNRGIAIAARALGEAATHIRDFFETLQAETAFYVGCATLHEQLAVSGLATCIPDMTRAAPALQCEGLYEPSLGLALKSGVVGNSVDADGATLIVITGANQGGKSTLLRALGVAQLMAQCGMFVAADFYAASLVPALASHYKREEDTALASGKFDEELARMSEIVDHFQPGLLLLCNESFASTSEREASDVADGVIETLRKVGARVIFVTHLYEYAHDAAERDDPASLFLRAARDETGQRSFNLTPGTPLRTSFGEDLYRRIFGAATPARSQERRAPKDSALTESRN